MLTKAFAVWNDVVGIVGIQLIQDPGVPFLYGLKGQSLQIPEISLPEAGILSNDVPGLFGDDGCRFHGSPKITADQSIKRDVFHPEGYRLRLSPAGVSQRAVTMPLKAFFDIPFGFTVADNQ